MGDDIQDAFEGTLNCEICLQTFASRESLAVHMKEEHGEDIGDVVDRPSEAPPQS
jgi:hypothetical protein